MAITIDLCNLTPDITITSILPEGTIFSCDDKINKYDYIKSPLVCKNDTLFRLGPNESKSFKVFVYSALDICAFPSNSKLQLTSFHIVNP